MGSQKFFSQLEHLERLALEFQPQENERDTTMKTTTKNTGIKVNTGVKAGGFIDRYNHNRSGLKIKAGIKAGQTIQLANHNRRLLSA